MKQRHAGGRPRAARPRIKGIAYMRPAFWTALEQVAIARSSKMRRRVVRADVIEAALMRDPEIAREVRRFEDRKAVQS